MFDRHEVPVRGSDPDSERFSSPEEFSTTVTKGALRRFDALRIEVDCPQLEVAVVLARAHGFGPPWLERGVFLQVRSRDDVPFEVVREIRDQVLAALNRGLPVSRVRGPGVGDGLDQVPPELTHRRAMAWLAEPLFPRAPRKTSRFLSVFWPATSPSPTIGVAPTPDRVAYMREHPDFDPRLLTAPPDVAAYLQQRPDLLKLRGKPRLGEVFLGGPLPAIGAAAFSAISIGWLRSALLAALGVLIVGVLLSSHLSRLVLFRVELTDVSRLRRNLARTVVWSIGPGLGLITFVVGRFLL